MSEKIGNPENLILDEVEIKEVRILPHQKGIAVAYQTGHVVDEKFEGMRNKMLGIEGDDFLEVANTKPDPNKTMYDNIRDILYPRIKQAENDNG